MEVKTRNALPLQKIMVAGEEVPVEWTGVKLYDVTYDDWHQETYTLSQCQELVKYWTTKKEEFVAKCDAEIAKINSVLQTIVVIKK